MRNTTRLKEGYKKALFLCKRLIKILCILSVFVMIVLHGLVITYKWVNPPLTNMMLIHWWKSGREMPLHSLRDHWIPLHQLSPYVVIATLINEDSGFFQHKGFYIKDMFHVLKQDLIHHKRLASSTITQQTVKNVLLYPQQSYFRKLLELYFAALLELIWGKDRILEVYLNILELGYGVYGIEHGTQYYFSKPASQICFDEACLLSAILCYPKTLSPLNPNTYVYSKASFAFKKGMSAAKKYKKEFPFSNGKYGLQ